MTWKLHASRYSNSFSSPVKLENLPDIADLGIRWAVPGGIQRIELTINAGSKSAALDRYNRHHGHRIHIYDNFIDKPIASGQIYEIIPDGNYVIYICTGAWKRHYDQHYTVADMSDLTLPTDNTDVVIKDVLDDTVTILGTDQSNIASTGLDIGAWHPEDTVGTPAGDAIAQLAAIGDSSSNPLDYYIRERPFIGIKPQAPIPVLEARSKTNKPDWIVSESDLVGGGLQQSRHIWQFMSTVRIGYGLLTGTHTAIGNSATTLTDSAADFINDGVTIGDVITNITDGSAGEVSSVTSATVLVVHGLAGGTDNDFDTNDVYGIRLKQPKWTSATTSVGKEATTDFWTVEHTEIQPNMDATHADNYAAALLDLYDKPVQQQAISIGSPTIRDGNGARWPLWRVLAENGGYIRFLDLKPEVVDSATRSIDRFRAFRIAAMDYTYSDNQLRIVPDSPDSRLDAIMQQAGLIAGQLVSSAPDLPMGNSFSKDTRTARIVRNPAMLSFSSLRSSMLADSTTRL